MFEDGIARGFAVECRYNTCNGIISNARRFPPHIVEQACSVARQRDVYSSRVFEGILNTLNSLDMANRQANRENPTPKDGVNLRGKARFA